MKHYKVISLDIWDTILRRKCHPDEIKLSTARYALLTCYGRLKPDYQNVQKLLLARIESERRIAGMHCAQEDDEYELHDVFRGMLREALVAEDAIPSIAEDLYRFELNKEAEMVFLDPKIVDTISQYSYDQLGYISDFYAGTDFIDTLLKKAGFPLQISFKYVSCDHMLNKRSGRLFQKVLQDMQIEPDQQLHIGDNPYSDSSTPKAMGIHTLHYVPAAEHAERKRRESYYSVENGHNLNLLTSQLYSGKTTSDALAPFFVNFVLWIIEDCVKRGIRKIYYFTREGEFFIKLHKVIQASPLFSEGIIPEAEVLEVSRVATFAASLREPTLSELMRLWNQYSTQSMNAFAKSVALKSELLNPWLEKYGIDADEVITYPWLDERVQRMFADADFAQFFQDHINNMRQLLQGYAQQRGLNKDESDTVAIVDIGWRGSIQDNLCHIYPNYRFVGYYLALEQFLNEQPVNSEKYGYMNDQAHYQYLLRIVSPIEMLSNSPNGSTVGYQQLPDHSYSALRQKEEGEDQIFEQYTKYIQQAILDRAEPLCDVLYTHSLVAAQLKEITYKRFANVLLEPTNHLDLIHAFFNLQHNEEFGMGRYVDKRTRLRLDLMVGAVLFGKKGRRKLLDFLNNTSWPQGYLAKYHLQPLILIYNRLLGIR